MFDINCGSEVLAWVVAKYQGVSLMGVCVHVYMGICVYVYERVCVFVCVRVYVCMCVCPYVRMCVCAYVCARTSPPGWRGHVCMFV